MSKYQIMMREYRTEISNADLSYTESDNKLRDYFYEKVKYVPNPQPPTRETQLAEFSEDYWYEHLTVHTQDLFNLRTHPVLYLEFNKDGILEQKVLYVFYETTLETREILSEGFTEELFNQEEDQKKQYYEEQKRIFFDGQ